MAICHYGEKFRCSYWQMSFRELFRLFSWPADDKVRPYCLLRITQAYSMSVSMHEWQENGLNQTIRLGKYNLKVDGKCWTLLDRRKTHLGARIAQSMLCGCSNINDVMLSILNESLGGQKLIGSRENTPDLPANPTLHLGSKSLVTINKSSVISKPIVVVNFALAAISQGNLRKIHGTNMWHSESEQWCFHCRILQQDWYLVGGEANEQLGNTISIIASLIVNPFHSEK